MVKEIKYLFYFLVIFLFIYLISSHYFSDIYKKKNYRKLTNFVENSKKKINIPIIKSDTDNIIEYMNFNDEVINQKKRSYWKLIE